MIHKLLSNRSNGSVAVTPRNLLLLSLFSSSAFSYISCRCASPLKRPLRCPSLLRADAQVSPSTRTKYYPRAQRVCECLRLRLQVTLCRHTNWAVAACASRGAAETANVAPYQSKAITLPSAVASSQVSLTLSASALCFQRGLLNQRTIDSLSGSASASASAAASASASASVCAHVLPLLLARRMAS